MGMFTADQPKHEEHKEKPTPDPRLEEIRQAQNTARRKGSTRDDFTNPITSGVNVIDLNA